LSAPLSHLFESRLVLGLLTSLAPLAPFACASPPSQSPFSAAEINEALAPVKQLRRQCYGPSALAGARRTIQLEFQLEVGPSGNVRATPTAPQPPDPEVIECVRRELNRIAFPARGHDRLNLHFEMGP
jgi:hypothetical protein